MFSLDDDALRRLLKEDAPFGDLTTRSLWIFGPHNGYQPKRDGRPGQPLCHGQ